MGKTTGTVFREVLPHKIEMSHNACNTMQRIGVSPQLVVQSIQCPDDLQKILPRSEVSRNWPVIFLYMKRFSKGFKEDIILVQAFKYEGTITVSAVWKTHPDDISVKNSANASEVFEAFLKKYGVNFKTSSGLTKLITYQTVTSTTTIKNGKWERIFNLPESILNAEDRRITKNPEILLNKSSRPLNIKARIAILYAINISNYLYDLSNHHV